MSRLSRTPVPWLTLAGLLLVAFNLRPALTSVAPVLSSIGATLGLASTGQSLLTTLPVICLGLAAPLAPRLSIRLGPERAVLVVLLCLALALALRPYTGALGLFVGTAITGGTIGIMGVLLPGLVKRDFPSGIGLMTGLYTMCLNLGAAAAAGATEPLRLALADTWQPALAFWLVPAVLAAGVWYARLAPRPRAAAPRRAARRLLAEPLAWQVTAFMGLQAALAYSVLGWLPTILADRGLTPVTAGLVLSVSILVQMISALSVPWAASRSADQRLALVAVIAATLVGIAGCLYAPLTWIWPAAVLLGLGQGGAFAMALTLLALRAPDAESAAELSGMAQGFGYVIAAGGPLVIGLIHEATGDWQSIGPFLFAIGLAAFVASVGAGRDRWVSAG